MGRLTHTVSGSIATVRSPAVAPIESLKVHFSPIQEGTGDPSPSNVRPITGWTGVAGYKSGKNLFDISKFEGKNGITVNGNTMTGTAVAFRESYNASNRIVYPLYIPAGSKVSMQFISHCDGANTSGAGFSINLYYLPLSPDSSIRAFYTNNSETTPTYHSGTITLEKDVGGIAFVYYNNALDNTWTVSNIQIEIGESATEYEPYKGYDVMPGAFPNFSTNLFDPTDETFVNMSKSNGIYSNSDVDSRTYAQFEIQLYNNTTLLSTLSPHNFTETGLISFDFSINDPLCNLICFKHNGITKDFRIRFPFTYGNGIYTISCDIISNDPTTVGGLQLSDISIKRGNENVIDYINNKVYGGYVNLATGEIFAEYGSYVLTGLANDGFVYRGTLTHGDNVHYQFGTKLFDRIVENTSSTKTYCNIAKATISQSGWTLDFMFYAGTPQYQVNFFIKDSVCDPTEESFNAWLSEHNVHFVYKLATPQLIATLTPQELATFKGYSNFWSNAGDIDVTYQVVESSEMTKERQKIFAGNAPSIHTASGSVANFEMEPGLNRNLKSCKVGFLPVQEGSGDPFPPINQNGSIVGVDNIHNESELSSFKIHFSPIQAGSGDPSPTNIRPITGWTGVTGYKGGKNLYSSGDQTFERFKKVPIGRMITPGTYTLSLNVTSTDTDDTGCDVYLFNGETGIGKSKGFSRVNRTAWTFTTDLSFDTLYLYAAQTWFAGEGDTATFSNIQLEAGSTATSYEAYSAPTSYPVSWESNGTVYGGYVDLVSGEVVATMLYKKHRVGDSQVDATYENTKRIDVLLDSDCLSKANGTTSNTISSYFTYAYNNLDNPHFYLTDPNRIRCFVPIDINDNTEIEFACTLLNPIVVTTLTPQQITLATGKSSYWSNADAVTVGTAGNVRPISGWSGITEYAFGKNLLDVTNCSKIYGVNHAGLSSGVIADSAVGSGNSDHVIFARDFPAGTYTLSCKYSGAGLSGTRILCTAPFDGGIYNQYYGGYFKDISNDTITITVEESFKVGLVLLSVYGAPTSEPGTIYDIQFEPGTVATEYEPYSSYESCSVTFPVQGKNLFNGVYVKGVITGNTLSGYTWNNSGTNANSAIIKCDPNTTYTIKKHSSSNRFSIATCSHYPVLNDVLNLIVENANISQYTCTTGNDAEYLIVYVSTGTEQAEPDLMVEVGSSASAYEPYDNSIFGGYVDLVTGEVWKEWEEISMKSLTWYNFSGNLMFGSMIHKVKQSDIYSTHFNPDKNTNPVYEQNLTYYNSSAIYAGDIYFQKQGMSKPADLEAWFKALPYDPRIVYKLETPVLVTTLTPTQIQALKGTNNILSDANGVIEVKYWSH